MALHNAVVDNKHKPYLGSMLCEDVTPYDVDMMIQDSVIGWHRAANLFVSVDVFLLCSMDKIRFV